MKMGLRLAAGAVLLAGLAGCGSTLQVKVGWDQNIDFKTYRTWAWKADGSIQDPVWARRCQDVLSDQLESDGLKQVGLDESPDLWAVVHARLSTQTEVVSYSPGWGYGYGAWGMANTVAYQVPVGTILIDLVDVKTKLAVWQGKANDAIASGKTNEEREEKLIKVLAQMFDGFPPGVSRPAAPAS